MGAKQEREGGEKESIKKEPVVRPFESEPLRHGQVPTGGTGQAFGGADGDERIVETLKEANKETAENEKKRKKRGS